MSDFKKALQSHFEKSLGYEKGQFDLKKQMAKKTFGGDDLLSSLIRGKLKGEKEKKGKSPSKAGEEGLGTEATSVLVIIAKNTMVLPGMARDVKNLSQNIQKLVKLKGGKPTSSASDFFRKQKEKAAGKLKPAKGKTTSPSTLTKAAPKATGIMDILGDIASFIGGALIEVVKSLFNPMAIIRLLGRLAIPALIITTLFAGIMAGWKKYTETGSFTEAIVSYFGGMLEFLTFGLLGEDQLKNAMSFLGDLFKPVLDSVTTIFDSIKGFFKNIFGDFIKIEDTPTEKPSTQTSTATESGGNKQQAPAQSAMNQASASFEPTSVKEANKTGEELTSKITEMGAPKGVVPEGIFGDLAGVMNAGAGGDFGAMIAAGEELKKKYPAQPKPAGPTAVEQSASNYELNKSLTQKASGALGVDLPMPAPPTPVMSAATAAAGGSATSLPKSAEKTTDLKESGGASAAPTPAPPPPPPPSAAATSGGDSYADKAETNRIGALQFMKRSLGIMPPDPKKLGSGYTDMRNGDKPLSEEEVRKRISAAGKNPDKIISLLNDTGKGGGTLDLSSGNLNTITGGAIGAGAGTSPMPVESSSSSSGAAISSASAEVAEGQRMESAADKGSVVNAGTTNNTSGSTGKPSKQTASAYDDSFSLKLATR